MSAIYRYDTEIGSLYIGEDDGVVDCVSFSNEYVERDVKETALIRQCYEEIEDYLHHQRTEFDLPVKQSGTSFQQQVWAAVSKIPYGVTASYQDIAKMIGRPKAYRAVGNAINKNKICLLIPCHRIIKQDGSLGGYNGSEDRKYALLMREGGFE